MDETAIILLVVICGIVGPILISHLVHKLKVKFHKRPDYEAMRQAAIEQGRATTSSGKLPKV